MVEEKFDIHDATLTKRGLKGLQSFFCVHVAHRSPRFYRCGYLASDNSGRRTEPHIIATFLTRKASTSGYWVKF